MSTITFSNHVLQSRDNLNRFLEGRSSIQAVAARKKDLTLTGVGKLGTWDVVWISITNPFFHIYAIFSRVTGELLLLSGVTSMGRRWVIYSEFLFDWSKDVSLSRRWGHNFLVRCINRPEVDSHDIYAHPSIKKADLPDEVKEVVLTRRDVLDFTNDDGKCRGISDWFAYIYHETRWMYPDPEKHLIAVANLFKDGAPREAQLLQTAFLDNETCLGLDCDWRKGVSIFRKDALSDDAYIKRMTSACQALKPGLYEVGIPLHRMNVIKIDAKRTYLHDPNIGLIAIRSPADNEKLWKYIHRYYSDGIAYIQFSKIRRAKPAAASAA